MLFTTKPRYINISPLGHITRDQTFLGIAQVFNELSDALHLQGPHRFWATSWGLVNSRYGITGIIRPIVIKARLRLV